MYVHSERLCEPSGVAIENGKEAVPGLLRFRPRKDEVG